MSRPPSKILNEFTDAVRRRDSIGGTARLARLRRELADLGVDHTRITKARDRGMALSRGDERRRLQRDLEAVGLA